MSNCFKCGADIKSGATITGSNGASLGPYCNDCFELAFDFLKHDEEVVVADLVIQNEILALERRDFLKALMDLHLLLSSENGEALPWIRRMLDELAECQTSRSVWGTPRLRGYLMDVWKEREQELALKVEGE